MQPRLYPDSHSDSQGKSYGRLWKVQCEAFVLNPRKLLSPMTVGVDLKKDDISESVYIPAL